MQESPESWKPAGWRVVLGILGRGLLLQLFGSALRSKGDAYSDLCEICRPVIRILAHDTYSTATWQKHYSFNVLLEAQPGSQKWCIKWPAATAADPIRDFSSKCVRDV